MRRCTVWTNQTWNDERYPRMMRYMGWLLQVDPSGGDYPKCVVVNDKGKMAVHDLAHVQLHVPTSIPLLHGAPRRADSDEISAAASAAPSTN